MQDEKEESTDFDAGDKLMEYQEEEGILEETEVSFDSVKIE